MSTKHNTSGHEEAVQAVKNAQQLLSSTQNAGLTASTLSKNLQQAALSLIKAEEFITNNSTVKQSPEMQEVANRIRQATHELNNSPDTVEALRNIANELYNALQKLDTSSTHRHVGIFSNTVSSNLEPSGTKAPGF